MILKSLIVSFVIFVIVWVCALSLKPNPSSINFKEEGYSHFSAFSSASIVQPIAGTTTSEIVPWKTYTNKAYGFSIRYPSDSQGDQFPFDDRQQNSYETSAMVLPTSQGTLTLITFTDGSVAHASSQASEDISGLQPSDALFPFTLTSLRRALQLPVDAPCTLAWADEATSSACVVVELGNHKAVEVAGYTRLDGEYFMNLRSDQWLELDPYYGDYQDHPNDYDRGYDWPGYVSHKVKPPPSLQSEMDAILLEISTLHVSP